MKKLTDLRFVIGLFFTIIGMLLMAWSGAGQDGSAVNTMINFRAGMGFFAFGGLMLLLSFNKSIS